MNDFALYFRLPVQMKLITEKDSKSHLLPYPSGVATLIHDTGYIIDWRSDRRKLLSRHFHHRDQNKNTPNSCTYNFAHTSFLGETASANCPSECNVLASQKVCGTGDSAGLSFFASHRENNRGSLRKGSNIKGRVLQIAGIPWNHESSWLRTLRKEDHSQWPVCSRRRPRDGP